MGIPLVLLLTVAFATVGCRQQKVEWNRTPRVLTYNVDERSPVTGEQHGWQLTLTFQQDRVTATEWGTTFPATMDAMGRLTALDRAAPPILYELAAVAVLPPPGNIRQGHKWSSLRPDDASAAASNAIVGQEKFDYEVLSTGRTTVRIKVSGLARIAPSSGLQRLAGTTTGPFISTGGTPYVPYVAGTAEFDVNSGSVSRAEGIRLPLAMLQGAQVLDTHPSRVEYRITRR
jgi:hypothetical protein